MAMPGAPEDIAVGRAEQWRQAFEQLALRVNGEPVTTTLSAGVSVWTGTHETLESALQRADNALYDAKQAVQGRGLSSGADGVSPA